MINLIQIAPNGQYQSGQLNGENAMPNPINLSWNGPTNDNRGFVRVVLNGLCEDQKRYNLLQMHPKWVSKGSIKGYLPSALMPTHAIFKAKVGFLKGATGSDGVTFQVWVHFTANGKQVGYRILNYKKLYNDKMTEVIADLSHLSGKNVRIELRVDAGNSSGQDWAVWADPKIEPKQAGADAKVFNIRPLRFAILNRNEESFFNGKGDEPYFGVLYFRSIFGKPGSTKVVSLTTLKTQGKNLGVGTYSLPSDSNLSITDTAVVWDNTIQAFTNGIQVSGYQMVAIEEDWHGKGVARDTINGKKDKLFKALVTHVENNIGGILNMEATTEAIKNEVSGESAGFLKKALTTVFAAITNADDLIGENGITLINLTASALQAQLGANYNPDSQKDPIGSVVPRLYKLEFKGSDARYRVDVEVSYGSYNDPITS